MTYDPWDYENHSPDEQRVRMTDVREVVNIREAILACRNSHDHQTVISTEVAFTIASWYASFEESLARLVAGETVAYYELDETMDALRTRAARMVGIWSPNDPLVLNALAWWIGENAVIPSRAPFLPVTTLPLFEEVSA